LAIRTAELAAQNVRDMSRDNPGQSEAERAEYERARKAKWRANKRTSNTSAKANHVPDVEGIIPEKSRAIDAKSPNFLSSLSLERRLSRKKDKEDQQVGTEYADRRAVKRPPDVPEKGIEITDVEGTVTAADKRKGTRIPPDWQPSESDREFASNLGWAI